MVVISVYFSPAHVWISLWLYAIPWCLLSLQVCFLCYLMDYQCTISCNCVALNIGVYRYIHFVLSFHTCEFLFLAWISLSKLCVDPFEVKFHPSTSAHICASTMPRELILCFISQVCWFGGWPMIFSKDTIFPWNITSQLRHSCSMSWVCKYAKLKLFHETSLLLSTLTYLMHPACSAQSCTTEAVGPVRIVASWSRQV